MAPEQRLFHSNFCSLTLSGVHLVAVCLVMPIKLLVVVFMALLLTTENLVLRDVKITFQQDFIKLMIMSRSDLH